MQFGRQPRTNDPRVPHLSALKMMPNTPEPNFPVKFNNADRLPGSVGAMLNDRLGDCTCAALYHAIQLWTSMAQPAVVTEPDDCVLQAYREVGGYDGTPQTDHGAVIQNVLKWATNTGVPIYGGGRYPLSGFFEVDTRIMTDIAETIYEFGCCSIGILIPQGFMPPHNLWTRVPNAGPTEFGHNIILTGADFSNPNNPVFNGISWGTKQWVIDKAFIDAYVDEGYGMISGAWIQATGKTPYNLSWTELNEQTSLLRKA